MRASAAAICAARLVLILGQLAAGDAGARDSLFVGQHRGLKQRVNVGTRIAMGDDAPCGRYPYMVSLRSSQDQHKCGGVLIDPKWVLTAAHCVDSGGIVSLGPNPVIVIGACLLNDTENENGKVEKTTPDETIIHEGWTGDVALGDDIALLKLREPSAHVPVALPVRIFSPKPSQRFVALGWGEQEADSEADPRQLQQATSIEFIDNEPCNSSSSWAGLITDTMLCAISFSGQSTCQGDSGGPLLEAFSPEGSILNGKPDLKLDVTVGITSFGSQDVCGDVKLPSVFTRVALYRTWIDDKMGKITSSDTGDMGDSSSDTPAVLPMPPPPQGMASSGGENTDDSTPESPTEPPMSAPSLVGDLSPEDQEMLDKQLLRLAASAENDTTEEQVLDLLDMGADPDACCADLTGDAALHETAENDNAAVAAALAVAGADPDIANKAQATPLHHAAALNAVEVAKVLITAGADVDARDRFEWTPLHMAADRGSVEVAEVLVESGADKSAQAEDGETPADKICGACAGSEALVALLA